jgi:RNA polymerase sigma factor (sigma-70 family)
MSTVTHSPSRARPSLLTPYEQHREYVLKVIAKRCRWIAPPEREALLHDAYVVLLEKLRNRRLTLEEMDDLQVRAYLTRTALYKALDERKRTDRRPSVSIDTADDEDRGPIDLASPESSVEDQVIAHDQHAALRQEIAGMPRRRQLVLTMRWWLGDTPEEIQRKLGVSERVYRRELERGTRVLTGSLASWR